MARYWRMAKSLDKLLAQINAYAPNRSKISDGGIGNAEHAARLSDHNPDSRGVVHARDFTHSPSTGFDAHKFARRLAAGKDRRTRYLISNRQISNPSIGAGRWRPYSGINPHTQHAHVSVVYSSLEDNTANWPGLGAAAGVVVEPSAPVEPKGVLGMTRHIKYSSKKKQTLTNKTKFLVLRVEKDSLSRVVVGPAHFAFTANIIFANLKPGYSAWIRIVRAGYKKGQPAKIGRTLAHQEVVGTTGGTYASVSATGGINKDYAPGYSTRVYILVNTDNPEPLNITSVSAEGLQD